MNEDNGNPIDEERLLSCPSLIKLMEETAKQCEIDSKQGGLADFTYIIYDIGYEHGQQNPDPKQYAKREELEKAIGKLTTSILGTMRFVARRELIELIRTHGLEE